MHYPCTHSPTVRGPRAGLTKSSGLTESSPVPRRADDPRALLVRRELSDGRIWGSTSVSAVAIGPDGIRYDFNAEPGSPAGWHEVALNGPA